MTDHRTQRECAVEFHRLHDELLVLPNAWDPPSARVIERAGAVAIASTSAGVAWSRGVADAGGLDRDTALDAAARMVAAVSVPVTVDVEWGYPDDAEGIEATIDAVIAAGAVGINLEDSRHGVLATAQAQSEVIARAVATVDASPIPLFVNARIDTYLTTADGHPPAAVLADTMSRAQLYAAAGAHGVFVPGLTDPEAIRTLARATEVPLNVMAGRGSAPVAELAALGVRRISVGPELVRAAYGEVGRWARSILTGSFSELPPGAPVPELVAPR